MNPKSTLLAAWSVFLLGSFAGCDGSSTNKADSELLVVPKPALSQESIEIIERFCGDCHAMPIPSTFPKARWPEEVRQGFDFYVDSKRSDLIEPTRQEVVQYFQMRAPDRVVVPHAGSMTSTPTTVRFASGPAEGRCDVPPAIAHLIWDTPTQSLLLTDMLSGTLGRWQPSTRAVHKIADGKNICRVTPCDWNQDVHQDYLLGELGSFPVGDHLGGQVTLLLGKDSGEFEQLVLASDLARVVEAIPFDYDQDGDMDVLVAEFGWRRTGALKLLRNMGGSLDDPSMQVEVLDARHGALGVQVADMDGDSKTDFVVAYGQEFETVEVHYNRAPGEYETQVVLQLPDPSYNSSSFQLVDLDQDGRLDIVHTCGDTMDALLAKPYHGLRWVRNLGNRKWENHELGLMVGALQSTVADFDSDGDLDIAAVGLFPNASHDGPGAYDSICWWEQGADLTFTRHSIERDHCSHAACAAGDVNGDGRIDLIVGQWMNQDGSAFRVFYNEPSVD